MPTGLKINCNDRFAASIALLGASYDKTASYRKGTSNGPSAIVNALLYQMETYDRFAHALPSPSRTVFHNNIEHLNLTSPETMVMCVKSEYEKCIDARAFVFLLGGEHSVTIGALQALASRNNPSDIAVCQIDAHLDMRQDDSDYNDTPYGKYAHCTVMRRAFELGFPCVNIGARACSREEMDFAHAHTIPVFEWGSGTKFSIDEIVAAIPADKIYLTIDVDGIDPAHMPATGTPVQGGLEWYYTIDLICELFKRKKVVGADIVEVAPRRDDVLTEYGAAQLCYTMLALGEKYGHIKDKESGLHGKNTF